ncbi:ER membrane protein complex subunit 8/9 homolog [Copidosoma floridanum]|uniref:ER membrane protein complex subunit 8/9 homolog n=1 Tax=Copidosoma floridanum TaxID=29053 RepID=UPI0006C98CBB|nr:ER membrane protein complex subunit 8/9 homolog [Copidosoma floridanum]XP_014213036.1 ER membrane protein complex subunit 8/9 homolog [Copidosoma floridanum]
MTDLSFCGRAYAKIILHAAKYPHCAINGLLLGKQKGNELQIVDAVPLFHICLHVSPMSEIALTTVEQMANSKGLVIAGYYLANENINDVSIDKPSHRGISEKIAENFNNAVIAVVDNKDMTIGMNVNPLRISQYSDGKWKFKDKSSIKYEGGAGLLEAMYYLMKNEEYRNLVDFDNHLDNISLDWRNLLLNDVIDDALKNHR